MLDNILLSLAIMSQLSGTPLPEAVEQLQEVYIVPTQAEQEFEWRLEDRVRSAFTPPIYAEENFDVLQEGPNIAAAAALVMDVNTGAVLWQKNPDDVRSIASITKLATVQVWMDNMPADEFAHVHTFSPAEDTPGGKELNLAYGQKLTAFDLLRSSIVASYNDTAVALAHTTGLSDEEFIALMNRKARALGMEHTTFVDQTGLEEGNRATVYDIALLARGAFAQPEIQEPAAMTEHKQQVVDSETTLRAFTTDKLLYDPELTIVGGKTGYTDEAGYCVVVQVREPESGRDMIAVVLGTESDDARFTEAKKLIQWTFAHYEWK